MRPDPTTGSQGRILLVDDDPVVLDVMTRFLARRLPGVGILAATDAEHALRVMETQRVDIVLVDHHLPRMNGLELLSQLRRRYPRTHRIMLTGEPDEDLAVKASHEAGAERFFLKPVDLGALSRVLQQILRAASVNPSPGAQR